MSKDQVESCIEEEANGNSIVEVKKDDLVEESNAKDIKDTFLGSEIIQ